MPFFRQLILKIITSVPDQFQDNRNADNASSGLPDGKYVLIPKISNYDAF
jgi:hypothetical protein